MGDSSSPLTLARVPSLTRRRPSSCSEGDESTSTAASGKSKPPAVATVPPRRTRSLSSSDAAPAAVGLPRRTRSSSSPCWTGPADFAAHCDEGRDECADDGGQSGRGSDDGPWQNGQTSGMPKESGRRDAGRDRPPLHPKPGKKSRKQSKRDSARTESATKRAMKLDEPVDRSDRSGRSVDPRLPELDKSAFDAGSEPTANWDLWTDVSSYPVSVPPDDSQSVGEVSACSVVTEYLADVKESRDKLSHEEGQRRRWPDESDGCGPPSNGPSLEARKKTKDSAASVIEHGQNPVRRKSSLVVRTQLESLALRTSFRSQLRLGIVQKSVRFDNLFIREYPVVIGDSPSTSRGVPLSIGWKYEPERAVNVDAYESTRVPGGKCERRTKYELRCVPLDRIILSGMVKVFAHSSLLFTSQSASFCGLISHGHPASHPNKGRKCWEMQASAKRTCATLLKTSWPRSW